MVNQHYGTMHIIRQCVVPGMLAKHDGHTWNVSAVRGKYVYLRTMRGAIRINDCLVEVLLNGWGDPMIHGHETTGAKCAYCKRLLQPGDEVKSTLLLLRGNMLAREERQYCSRQCAEHDLMAHEP
ncbi:YdaE family protein [Atlantibacter hermannii]|uniref:YdaE family protein n=1 Tax=Atlantibacter hermannii TaxID=565 RepID=UPI0035E3E4A4